MTPPQGVVKRMHQHIKAPIPSAWTAFSTLYDPESANSLDRMASVFELVPQSTAQASSISSAHAAPQTANPGATPLYSPCLANRRSRP
eukprot:4529974-Pleurochrysis_carterae.AAC.1